MHLRTCLIPQDYPAHRLKYAQKVYSALFFDTVSEMINDERVRLLFCCLDGWSDRLS